MPFDWTINPYRGCEFACKYCYARYTHEFMEMRGGVDFERKIYVKQQAAWLLRQDSAKGETRRGDRHRHRDRPLSAGGKALRGAALEILEELAQHHGLKIGIVTKSDLIRRDVELLRRVAEHNSLYVNLTVTTLNIKLARILEPRAPRPDLRLEAVRELCAAGLNAGVICAPVLPGMTDSPAALDALVRATKEAGGEYIYANPLFLKPCSASVFLPFLEKEFPKLVDAYRKRYRRAGVCEQSLQQAYFGADGELAQEAWHQPRVQFAQPERASANVRGAAGAVYLRGETQAGQVQRPRIPRAMRPITG